MIFFFSPSDNSRFLVSDIDGEVSTFRTDGNFEPEFVVPKTSERFGITSFRPRAFIDTVKVGERREEKLNFFFD